MSFIACALACQCCAAGEVLARFDAGEPEAKQGLRLDGLPSLRQETRGGQTVLRMDPSGRYYEEDVWAFRIAESGLRARTTLILEVEFWDEGYGLTAVPPIRGTEVTTFVHGRPSRLRCGIIPHLRNQVRARVGAE